MRIEHTDRGTWVLFVFAFVVCIGASGYIGYRHGRATIAREVTADLAIHADSPDQPKAPAEAKMRAAIARAAAGTRDADAKLAAVFIGKTKAELTSFGYDLMQTDADGHVYSVGAVDGKPSPARITLSLGPDGKVVRSNVGGQIAEAPAAGEPK